MMKQIMLTVLDHVNSIVCTSRHEILLNGALDVEVVYLDDI